MRPSRRSSKRRHPSGTGSFDRARALHEQMVEPVRPALFALAGAVARYVVACVNVANCCWREAPHARASRYARGPVGEARTVIRQMLTRVWCSQLPAESPVWWSRRCFIAVCSRSCGNRMRPRPRSVRTRSAGRGVHGWPSSLATGLIFGLAPAFVSTAHAREACATAEPTAEACRLQRMLGGRLSCTWVALRSSSSPARAGSCAARQLQRIDPAFAQRSADGVGPSFPERDTRSAADAFYRESLSRFRRCPASTSAADDHTVAAGPARHQLRFHRLDRPKPAGGQSMSGDVRPVTGIFNTMGFHASPDVISPSPIRRHDPRGHRQRYRRAAALCRRKPDR